MVRQRSSPSAGLGRGASAISKWGDLRPDSRPRPVALQPPGASAIVRAMSATARLAEFVVKTTLRDCPESAIIQVRRAALDTLGVTLAGAGEPAAVGVRGVVRAEGGTPLCTVFGTSLRTAPTWAA